MTKSKRGWTESKMDSSSTEIDLDHFQGWDEVFHNDNDGLEEMSRFISQTILPRLLK